MNAPEQHTKVRIKNIAPIMLTKIVEFKVPRCLKCVIHGLSSHEFMPGISMHDPNGLGYSGIFGLWPETNAICYALSLILIFGKGDLKFLPKL